MTPNVRGVSDINTSTNSKKKQNKTKFINKDKNLFEDLLSDDSENSLKKINIAIDKKINGSNPKNIIFSRLNNHKQIIDIKEKDFKFKKEEANIL